MITVLNLYGIILVLYFLLHILFGDRLGFTAFFSNCIPSALFPGLLAVSLALRKRNVLLMSWGSLATLLLMFTFGPRFVSKRHERPAPPLRILSHNTGQDLPGYDMRNSLILQSGADLVVLQEVTKEYIEQYWPELFEVYPYYAIGPFQSDRDQLVGMGILSKYPITEISNFKLAEKGLVYQQRAVIEVGNQSVVLYNVHTTFPWIRMAKDPFLNLLPWPTYDDTVRRDEVTSLVELVKREELPMILAGDFNLSEQSSDYVKLTNAPLVDAYKSIGRGFGFSWPANRTPSVNIRPAIPFVRVDYLFHSHGFRADSAKVLGKTGSDHKPLLVELSFSK